LSRLETLDQSLAAQFKQASKSRQAEAIRRALREALRENGISLDVEVDLLLVGSMPEKHMAELGSTCRAFRDQFDGLYFDQEEAGEPESVWGKSFQKSRAYAAIVELCEKQWGEALYEALHSLHSNEKMVASLLEDLNR
jgi:hypothetical protein